VLSSARTAAESADRGRDPAHRNHAPTRQPTGPGDIPTRSRVHAGKRPPETLSPPAAGHLTGATAGPVWTGSMAVLQFPVPLSTTDQQTRSPADQILAGQRAFPMSSSVVELRGFEPLTPTLPVWCATSCATAPMSQHRISSRPCQYKLHDARLPGAGGLVVPSSGRLVLDRGRGWWWGGAG
jgi:hypothetical protein